MGVSTHPGRGEVPPTSFDSIPGDPIMIKASRRAAAPAGSGPLIPCPTVVTQFNAAGLIAPVPGHGSSSSPHIPTENK
eukprot:692165-Hanusia_phi.AAC.7